MENLEKILERIDNLEDRIKKEENKTVVSRSESIIEIAKALSNFQADVKNPINTTTNSFFKNKYATLADVLNEVRPVLAKHGLSFIQTPTGDGVTVTLSTLLMHSSGEWIELAPIVIRVDKVNAQGVGSAISYARRYSLSSILGVASEDDDDGNLASQPDKEPSNSPAPKKSTPKKTSAKNELKELIAEIVDKAKVLQACDVPQNKIMDVFKDKGHPNPNTIPSIEVGKSILEELDKLG